MTQYFRPLLQSGPARPVDAAVLAAGWTWFSHVEVLERGGAPQVISLGEVPQAALDPLLAARAPIRGMSFEVPRIMGILNATPDSFSDGGVHATAEAALAGAAQMTGADILDVGGESTRPGAPFVPVEVEIARTLPVITALRAAGHHQILSIDTRKSEVAQAALEAGADLVNDVSGFTFDAGLAPLCAQKDVPVCVMHAQGDPATMQNAPHYDDVLLDVYDFLAERVATLTSMGVAKHNIVVDPGIGFGKTLEHNLMLLARLSLFHGLGVAVLLGASRKRFIGTIGGGADPTDRMPGSLAVALAALKQGTQIVRVHDVPETAQAIALWRAVMAGESNG
ncbi:MAG: dihydropteroate synthase [Roseobacter sp.]|jgi:dihydropteroate synthase|nr:dihydropteroate synthase [Roseobacter sp.]